MNKVSIVVAACVVSALGGMMFNTMPVFLGAAAEAYSLSEEQIGFMVSAYLLGFTLISLTAVAWIRNSSWRRVVLASFIAAFIAFYSYLTTSNYSMILVLQFILGICMGAVFNIALSIISDTSDPDRFMAFKVFSEIGLGAALLYILPNYVMTSDMPAEGLRGVIYSMMGLLVVGGFFIPLLPARAMPIEIEIDQKHDGNVWPVWLGLIALMIHFGGMTAIWAFQYEIGSNAGIDAGSIGTIISLSVLISMGGALTAAAISDRFGRVIPMLVSMGMLFVCLLAFTRSETIIYFGIACALLSIGWNYILPYQMGLVVEVDPTGRLSILIAAALTLGGTVGPGIAGMIVSGKDYTGLYLLVGGSVVISTAILIYLLRFVHHRHIAQEPAAQAVVQ